MLLPLSPAKGERKLRVSVTGLLHSLVVNCLLSMCLNLIHSTTKRKKEWGEEGKEGRKGTGEEGGGEGRKGGREVEGGGSGGGEGGRGRREKEEQLRNSSKIQFILILQD